MGLVGLTDNPRMDAARVSGFLGDGLFLSMRHLRVGRAVLRRALVGTCPRARRRGAARRNAHPWIQKPVRQPGRSRSALRAS